MTLALLGSRTWSGETLPLAGPEEMLLPNRWLDRCTEFPGLFLPTVSWSLAISALLAYFLQWGDHYLTCISSYNNGNQIVGRVRSFRGL